MVLRSAVQQAGLVMIVVALNSSAGASVARPFARPPSDTTGAAGQMLDQWTLPGNVRRACDLPRNSIFAHCLALYRTDQGTAAPAGYGPADLRTAYDLPWTQGYGQTVAVIEAYGDPHAEADLRFYRATFGEPRCTTKNGCFQKVNQDGDEGNYPIPSRAWGLETSLDVDMISAVCPNCHILVVEANNVAPVNLGAAVDTAVRLGANAVSNSYISAGTGNAEFYDHPGVIITASAGDAGFGVGVPAGLPTVVAVGGTSLKRAQNARGWSETVWKGSGSGCESSLAKPAWQTDRGCPGRTMNDVSAVSDPLTPVAIYDTYGYGGWVEGAGTSAASPLVAAIYALGGNAASLDAAQSLYLAAGQLNDVTIGSDGICLPSYLCTAALGYDGPSGNGTPNGVGAF
jgi:subtilase family serine protease